jgi:hypothetical protein
MVYGTLIGPPRLIKTGHGPGVGLSFASGISFLSICIPRIADTRRQPEAGPQLSTLLFLTCEGSDDYLILFPAGFFYFGAFFPIQHLFYFRLNNS